jgi:hypothetical protein
MPEINLQNNVIFKNFVRFPHIDQAPPDRDIRKAGASKTRVWKKS